MPKRAFSQITQKVCIKVHENCTHRLSVIIELAIPWPTTPQAKPAMPYWPAWSKRSFQQTTSLASFHNAQNPTLSNNIVNYCLSTMGPCSFSIPWTFHKGKTLELWYMRHTLKKKDATLCCTEKDLPGRWASNMLQNYNYTKLAKEKLQRKTNVNCDTNLSVSYRAGPKQYMRRKAVQ